MTDEAAIRQAVLSLEAALAEEYPGESLDPAALRTVLDELERLQGIEGRAKLIAEVRPSDPERRVAELLGPIGGELSDAWAMLLIDLNRLRGIEQRAVEVRDTSGHFPSVRAAACDILGSEEVGDAS